MTTAAQAAAVRVLVAEVGSVHTTVYGVASIPGAITVSLFNRDADPMTIELNSDGTIHEVRTSRDLGVGGLEIQDHTDQPLGDQLRAALTAQKDRP